MPLKTFTNLSPERQKEIINVSLEEFAQYDYESASLSRIVERLGLAKGSFYRYFENKKELFAYLSDFSRTLQNHAIQESLGSGSQDFFSAWTDLFLKMKRIEEEYPMIIRFRYKDAQQRSDVIFGGERANILKRKVGKINGIIKRNQEGHEIRDDIEADILSLLTMNVILVITDYFTVKYDKKYHEPVLNIPDDELTREVEKFVSVLRDGIAARRMSQSHT